MPCSIYHVDAHEPIIFVYHDKKESSIHINDVDGDDGDLS